MICLRCTEVRYRRVVVLCCDENTELCCDVPTLTGLPPSSSVISRIEGERKIAKSSIFVQ